MSWEMAGFIAHVLCIEDWLTKELQEKGKEETERLKRMIPFLPFFPSTSTPYHNGFSRDHKADGK